MRARLSACCVLALLVGGVSPAQAVDRLSVAVADVVSAGLVLRDIRAEFDAARGTAAISVARARFGERVERDLRLRCGRAALDFQGFTCHRAVAQVGGKRIPAVFDLELDRRHGHVRMAAVLDGGGRLELDAGEGGRVHARLAELKAEGLQALLAAWSPSLVRRVQDLQPSGRVSGELDWQPGAGASPRLEVQLRLSEAGFGTADGLRAAEKLAVDLSLDARRSGAAWHWQLALDWQAGAAYLHPLFLEAGPRLSAHGRLDDRQLHIERAELELEGVRRVSASASADLDALDQGRLALEVQGADLAVVGPRWIAPLVAPASAERWAFAGHASGALQLAQGRLQAAEVAFDAAGFSLAAAADGTALALGPIGGALSWRAGQRSGARLQVAGGHWGKLALGGFEVDAELMGEGVTVARTRVPVLDGALVLDDLSLWRGAAGWVGRGSVVIEPVSMPALTAALELPQMPGVLSASLPGLRVSPGEIALDGALVISVFDGYLHATGLRLREPFGVAAHLSADVEARHIDLAQLTETFSFGSMSGFVDADVRGLELARWRPVAFAARIASSPGEYRRRISQRAVENIGALGGAGAIAAIQRSLLRLFDTFGYSELGLQCRLARGVCLMDGIEGATRADGGFVIVRGGGVPALDVIGYNRRVDWDELVDRLQRVIAGNVSPELR